MPLSADGDIIEFGWLQLYRRERTLLADGLKLDLGAQAFAGLQHQQDHAGQRILTNS